MGNLAIPATKKANPVLGSSSSDSFAPRFGWGGGKKDLVKLNNIDLNELDRVKAAFDPSKDINKREYDQTVLHKLLKHPLANEDVYKFLKNNGIDLHAKGEFGGTAIHDLVENWGEQKLNVLNDLISSGVDVNAKEDVSTKATALHHIFYESSPNIEAANVILNANFDVDATNDIGNTPLHALLGHKKPNEELIKLLLEKGADKELENEHGLTALERYKLCFPKEAQTYTRLQNLLYPKKEEPKVPLKTENKGISAKTKFIASGFFAIATGALFFAAHLFPPLFLGLIVTAPLSIGLLASALYQRKKTKENTNQTVSLAHSDADKEDSKITKSMVWENLSKEGQDYSEKEFEKPKIKYTTIKNCSFNEAGMQKPKILDSVIEDSNFSLSRIFKPKFLATKFKNTNFKGNHKGFTYSNGSTFDSCNLSGINAEESQWIHTNFKNSSFSDSRLAFNTFESVIFEDCNFENASFFHSTFKNCSFINCSLNDAQKKNLKAFS